MTNYSQRRPFLIKIILLKHLKAGLLLYQGEQGHVFHMCRILTSGKLAFIYLKVIRSLTGNDVCKHS